MKSILITCLFFILFLLTFTACQHKQESQFSNISIQDSIIIDSLKAKASNSLPDSAIHIYQKLSEWVKEKKYTKEVIYIYCDEAVIYALNKEDFLTANKLIDSANQLIINENFNSLNGYKNIRLGLINNLKDSAFLYYKNALNEISFLSNKDKILLYGQLCFHYINNKNYKQAYQYGILALKTNREFNYPKKLNNEIAFLNNMYKIELGLKDTSIAYNYLKQAAILVNDSLPQIGNFSVYQNLGKYYLQKNILDSSLNYFIKFETIIKRDFTPDYEFYPLVYFSQIYLAKKKYKLAEINLKKASTLLQPDSVEDAYIQKDFYETQYKLSKAINNNTTALKALEKRNYYNNILYEKEKNDQLLNYEKEIEDASTAKEIAQREVKLSQQKKFNLLLLIGWLILLGISSIIYNSLRRKRLFEEQKRLALIQQVALEKTQLLLEAETSERNRIAQEIHDDLGSTLTSITMAASMLKHVNGLETSIQTPVNIIAKNSSELSSKTNEIVWSLNNGNDNIQSLAAYIRKFATPFLEQAGIQFIYTNQIDNPLQEIIGYKRRYIYTTVKELINNAVKHANATIISFDFKSIKNNIYITIKDNGKGIENNNKILGNGLKNTRNIIEKIDGTIDWINDNGTTILIKIRLQKS